MQSMRCKYLSILNIFTGACFYNRGHFGSFCRPEYIEGGIIDNRKDTGRAEQF